MMDEFIDVELIDRTIAVLKRWLRVAPKPSFLNADTRDLLRDLETVKQLETK